MKLSITVVSTTIKNATLSIKTSGITELDACAE
jgi:hypothetical protein